MSSAAKRVTSIAIMTGRLRRNSTHGASGVASSAPTARPAAASVATSPDPPCSTVITISGNAPNARPVPNVLTAYADHSQPNSRPSERRRATMPAIEAVAAPLPQTTIRAAAHNHRLYLYAPAMDLEAVRTFVAVASAGQFREAAAELNVTQQAVSKRIAALEKSLGVRLFTRSARGAALTIDGQAFLPHARALLAAEERAAASVRPGRRALRVDVIERRLAPAGLLRAFHYAYPEIELGVVTLQNADVAVSAVRDGQIDAAIRAVARPGTRLSERVAAVRVDDEPLHVLVGPGHPLADERSVPIKRLAGHRIWMPTVAPGTEWGAYYLDMAAEFGLTLDTVGPGFGLEPLLATVADSTNLATFVGERTDLAWPEDWGLRRVVLTDPTPIYPHSLVWHADNAHPALAVLRRHLTAAYEPHPGGWSPAWAG